MEITVINNDVYKDIVNKLDTLIAESNNNPKKILLTEWLDINETCKILKISKRTLQSYRDNNMLSYSQIIGKIYFKVSDIEQFLNDNYIKNNNVVLKNKKHI